MLAQNLGYLKGFCTRFKETIKTCATKSEMSTTCVCYFMLVETRKIYITVKLIVSGTEETVNTTQLFF